MRRLVWLVIAACGANGSPAKDRDAPRAAKTTAAAHLAVASEDVTFEAGADKHAVPGTLVHPTAPGKYPAVVLMAGSGPTDRDWNSPLLPSKNGSAKLLAEALAQRGTVVLRFDKAGVGGNKASLETATIDIYRDEGRAALALVRARPDVDPRFVFVAGHSEGGIHAIRVALEEKTAIAGLVLLSSAGRTMKDIMLGQVEAQLRQALPGDADRIIASMRSAFDDFLAGKDVDPDKVVTLTALRQLVAAVVYPKTATLSRGLLGFDPLPAVAQITVPVFIYNGLKDMQVDPERDARGLEHALKGAHRDVTVFLAPDANHVLKHETKTLAELRADPVAVQTGYNAPDRVLDDATVGALASWLAAHATSTR